jgi:crotonobetainyl-CoA:carnitine CoA-transferase CaiB-like acyl-CoA transferase
MTRIMEGIRVVELASWTFVPAAGAILADWGADVIKIEHPSRPDPQRGLRRAGIDANVIVEQANRGKRSVAVDISTPSGLELLYELVATADVFLTNWLPSARAKRGVDVEDVRARNPRIVYARGHGQGSRGPDADRPGFDGTAYLARGGFSLALTPPESEWPISGSAAVGDLPGAVTIAGGICGALFHRERTGVAPVVDISLLGLAMWTVAPDILTTGPGGATEVVKVDRTDNPNPLSIQYRTADGRFVKLSMFESDRFFADLCDHLDVPHLAFDARFADASARTVNRRACVAALDEAVGTFTLADLQARFATLKGAWAVVQGAADLHTDLQVLANGYLAHVQSGTERDVAVVAPPVQYDEQAITDLGPSPEHGQHTEEVLLELGHDWDEICRLQRDGVV